jgi:hypothetical protein
MEIKHLHQFMALRAICCCAVTAAAQLSDINLLILDECHHSQKNHPYRRIMVEFYHPCNKVWICLEPQELRASLVVILYLRSSCVCVCVRAGVRVCD